MTWWAIGINAAVAIGGAAISADAAGDAADTAAAGSQAELDLIRESRDLARADQTPYREAGYTALDALMSMTGLAQPSGGGGAADAPAGDPAAPSFNVDDYLRGLRIPGQGQGYGPNAQMPALHEVYGRGSGMYGDNRVVHRALGGPIGQNTIYNVNEFGPERIYENGSYTRSDMPRTIAPGGEGYVTPNVPAIQGAGFGSFLKKAIGIGIGGSRPIRSLQGKNPYPNLMSSGSGSGVNQYAGVFNTAGMGGPQIPGFNAPNSPNQDFGDPLRGTYQSPGENPGGVEGGYNFQTDPGYNFRLGEGMRALERGSAAAGGLLSGGHGRRATRYAQDYASNEYQNVYNRISNIAGLGQVSAQSSGNQALIAGQGMGTAAAQGATASAYGQQAQGNAWANAANQLGQIDWGGVFNRGSNRPPGQMAGDGYGPPTG